MSAARKLLSWIPDEWLSAISAFRDLLSDVDRTSYARVKHIAGYTVVWACGAVLGVYVWRGVFPELVLGHSSGIDGLMRAVMTMVGILAGFMITLMLFTGKTEAWRSLTLEQARVFAEKASYLLFSQFITLLNHILVIACCVSWFFLNAQGRAMDTQFVVILVCGFLMVSLFRTLLVPLQIAELHRFALSSLLADKEQEILDEVARLRK